MEPWERPRERPAAEPMVVPARRRIGNRRERRGGSVGGERVGRGMSSVGGLERYIVEDCELCMRWTSFGTTEGRALVQW